MKKIFSFSAVVLLLVACDKGKFETKPQIRLKSINTRELQRFANLKIVLEFTDKEGDVSDTLFFFRQRLNINGPLTAITSPYLIPNFPNTPQGEIEINLEYANQVVVGIEEIRIPGTNPSENEPDTMLYKIVVGDKAGNYSDTLTLDQVIVER